MKMRIIIFLYVLCSINIGTSQSYSELKVSLVGKSDMDKFKACLYIVENEIPNDSQMYFIDLGLKLAEKLDYDTLYHFYKAKSHILFYKGKLQEAKNTIRKAEKYCKYSKHPKVLQSSILSLLGAFSENMNQFDSAKYFYKKGLEVIENESSESAIDSKISIKSNQAALNIKEGNLESAIDMYFDVIKDCKKSGNNYDLTLSYINLASAYKELKEYEDAEKYFNKGIQGAEQMENYRLQAAAIDGIGQMFYLKGDYEKALDYFNKERIISEREKIIQLQFVSYNNLAETYLILKDQKNAKKYIEKTIQGCKDGILDDYTLSNGYITYAKVLRMEDNFIQANIEIDNAIKLSQRLGLKTVEKNAIEEKLNIYFASNQSDQGVDLFREYQSLNDTIYNNEKLKIAMEAGEKYKSELKDAENERLRLQKGILFAGIVGLLLLAGGGFYTFKTKKDTELLKQKSKTAQLNLQLTHKALDMHHISGSLYTMGANILKVSEEAYNAFISFSDVLRSRLNPNFAVEINQRG